MPYVCSIKCCNAEDIKKKKQQQSENKALFYRIGFEAEGLETIV